MVTLVRNKLIIIPNSDSEEEYKKQINDVATYCAAMEDGIYKNISFTKIKPKPVYFEPGSKEEDDWMLRNWGTRFKALNACWISDDEMIFDTYWNPAIPIFLDIIKNFPDIEFKFTFASKKIGLKSGEIEASEGKIISFKRFENFSKEAYDAAFDLMPHMKDFYILNMNTHTYDYDTSDFMAQISKDGFYKEADGTVLIGCDDKQKPLFDSINDLPF